GGGEGELVDLATHGDPHARALALRGLGRVGGARSLTVLRAALADPEPAIVVAAAGAIGVAASLDDLEAATQHELGPALAAVLERTANDPAVIEAIGRAADADAQQTLTGMLLKGDPRTREAAAL